MIKKDLKYILIVNSEPDVADLFAEMLLMTDEKYAVNIAYTANECLLTLERDAPDMILLDIELSDMDGWELIGKIKESKPDIPLVVVTARLPRMDDFYRLSMVSDYLVKPVTTDGLHMAVKDALEIPFLLERCIDTVKKLMTQVIIDRKRFVLMRQLYSDRELKNEPDARLLLDCLRKKIERARYEIEEFKNKECLLFT